MTTIQQSSESLIKALGAVAEALVAVGPDRIELVTVTRSRACLQPTVMADGERIARSLGCDRPLDHRMITAGHTLWTGDVQGLEVQVRAELRRPSGALA